jgi:uncharacterized membrane protein YkvA (DUF1232 family)
MIDAIKKKVYILYLAYKDPRVSIVVKILAISLIAYLLSPVDLIPDFIPVLGYLDDLLILPVGLWIVFRLIPEELINEFKTQAQAPIDFGKMPGRVGAGIIILIWVTILVLICWLYLTIV